MEHSIDEDIKEIEKFKKEIILNRELAQESNYIFIDYEEALQLINVIEKSNKELETYKKIAEILAQKLVDLEWRIDICDYVSVEICESYGSDISNCKQCIIDWARNEVEKDDN